MDAIIIGGGASGLVSAIKLARNGYNVKIIERNNKCGKKILITGNGRCNYYNSLQSIEKYHTQDIEEFKVIFNNENDKILEFFDSLGVVPKIKNGYYYPASNQASTILSVLLREVQKLNVEIIYEEKVIDILKEDRFIITTSKNKYESDIVVVATGGKAKSITGSDGSGYDLVKKFGHTLSPIMPSLVGVNGSDKFYKDWDGVRSEATVSLYIDNKFIKSEMGEVQLTKNGISGICVFNLSGFISEAILSNKKCLVNINFVPWFKESKEEFISFLEYQDKKLNHCNVREILEGFLNEKIVNLILKILKIDSEYLNQVDIKKLADLIVSFPFIPTSVNDIENAQVTKGGVRLNEINPYNMESKKVKGLYLVGEILDVDGDCGGYNLSFAWMSALNVGGKYD